MAYHDTVHSKCSKCSLFLESPLAAHLFIPSVELWVSSIVTSVHDFKVLVCHSAWITEHCVMCGYLARLLAFTDGCGDLEAFVVW